MTFKVGDKVKLVKDYTNVPEGDGVELHWIDELPRHLRGGVFTVLEVSYADDDYECEGDPVDIMLKEDEKGYYFNINQFELADEGISYPNPPHKYHHEIIAWAKGAEIEGYNPKSGSWKTLKDPLWVDEAIYRIKQQEPELPNCPFCGNTVECYQQDLSPATYTVNCNSLVTECDFFLLSNTEENVKSAYISFVNSLHKENQ